MTTKIGKPLSSTEMAWVKRMERVLKDMPKRLVMVEAADTLYLVDVNEIKGEEIYDQHLRKFVLHDFRNGTFKVTGTTG